MRVLWVSHFVPYPPKGGALQRGFGLISGLSRHVDVHLLALNQPRLLKQTLAGHAEPLSLANERLGKYCKSIVVCPIPSENIPFGRPLAAAIAAVSGRSFTETWLWSTALRYSIRDAIRNVQPQLVHFDTISLAPYASAVPADIPISLGHHNIESLMMRRRAHRVHSTVARWYLGLESKRICQLERSAAKSAALQVVCSDRDAERLRRLRHLGKIVVAENGVGEPEFDPDRDLRETDLKPSNDLAFVGRMSAYTNRDAADWLVRSIWPLVRLRFPEARLHIVGSTPPGSALALADTDPNVKVWGFVESVQQILRPGTVLMCPVRDGGGTKLKVLDAMNRGWPLIAHPVALEGLALRNGVEAIVARTAEEFADAAVALLQSQERRHALARHAFYAVRARYSFEAICARLASDWESVAVR